MLKNRKIYIADFLLYAIIYIIGISHLYYMAYRYIKPWLYTILK